MKSIKIILRCLYGLNTSVFLSIFVCVWYFSLLATHCPLAVVSLTIIRFANMVLCFSSVPQLLPNDVIKDW